ncbi:MAG: alpha-L-fucosidase [Massilibacteroides sp.]|nr:alpha-L-fucosidase [Massilibacteroides sp.]MDD4115177.1 alpha-L-fucosidase [Massilibacteroides sp.]MDD4659059.1 alpha-L-fucosidase [Massilibacteroides sp.]
MKVLNLFIFLFLGLAGAVSAQLNSFPESYYIDQQDIGRARKIISTPLRSELKMPNPDKDAQWFPEASLGLFMHWGIHSVVGAQPSWDMISNYIYGGKVSPPDKYYALAEQFNPQEYDPGKWLKAAEEAGFTYAVLTTKHHDGYALWPSKYGIGTKQYMNGRDLLKPYVDACRKNGLKVGFYFSPRDWHYPGLMHPNEYDALTKNDIPPVTDSVANYHAYEKFLGFVLKQIEELLTSYGKIDVLWLDGMYFRGVSDMHTEQVYAWIRSLQPGIVINDRWSNVVNPDDPSGSGMRIGDFTTPFECTKPTYIPSEWWEHCDIWTSGNGGWGYDKTGVFKPYSWFFEHLAASRSLGGNFLPNVGPAGNGEMPPNFYVNMKGIAEWMEHSRESLIGAGPSPGVGRSNVMITSCGNTWYLHLLPQFTGQVSLKTDKWPKSVTLLRTGQAVAFSYWDGFIKFNLSPDYRTEMDDVVKVQL